MARTSKKGQGGTPKEPHMVRKSVGLAVSVLLAAFLIVFTVVMEMPFMSQLVTRIMGGLEEPVVEELQDQTDQEAREAADQVEAEGAVLLANDGTLPLSHDTARVNVFGWASVDWQGGGSGSGGVGSVDVDLLEALDAYGVETNAELTDMYEDFQAPGKRARTLSSTPEESSTLFEPSIDDRTYYTDELLANAREFSDTALVVLGRFSGESNDLTLSQYVVSEKGAEAQRDDTRTTLDLSAQEEALLAYVGETYENVIVVVNSANPLALGAVETTPGVDAVLWVGYTGQYAAEAVPSILWGDTNPSGRTVDTFAYDLSTAPSYANASEHVGAYTDADGLYPADGETENGNLGETALYDQVSYVDYAEGIYVGYKWYETADAEGFWDGVSNEHGTGYEGVVQYPFGYGLSYTTFDWEVVDAPEEGSPLGDAASVTVRVTNTGDVAGKDVVELYFGAPYVSGQVEKSAVELGAFAKTRLLEPGESQELELCVDTRDMASYDCYDANENGFCGYELDPGSYVLTLRHDAHRVDDDPRATVTLALAEGVQYPTDEKTGATVENRFTGEDATDGVGVDGLDSGQDITYLSRADFAGTFPEPPTTRPMPSEVAELNLYTDEEAEAAWDALTDAQEMPVTGAENGLAIEQDGVITDLGRELGSDEDDPRWEELLDQLTVEEMENLVLSAYSGTTALPSVGKDSDSKEADGPAQIGGFIPVNPGTGFPCSAVMAQTWNVELANQMGRLEGTQAAQRGFSGWYAPAVNIHRSPFNGRNYEYYSEDSLLSGLMCGNVVSGARDAGVYCYVKHFVCNDGESYIYRDSVYLWMSEQALRETYLEPFRILVEDFGGTALMTSYNRIGAVWTGGSEALLTDVLRGEWGFEGTVVTDYCDHPVFMNNNQMLYAGGDLWMQMMPGELVSCPDSAGYVQALRDTAKHVLFTYLDARVANEAYVEASGNAAAARPASSALTSPGPAVVVVLRVVAVAVLALGVWRFVVGLRLRREQKGR